MIITIKQSIMRLERWLRPSLKARFSLQEEHHDGNLKKRKRRKKKNREN